MPQQFVKVARISDLSTGQKMLVQLGNERVLLVNLDGTYYAVEEVCPHAFAILSMGQLYGDEIGCPLHGSSFNVKTGAVLSPPCTDDLVTYSVRVEGEDILIGPHAS